VEEATDLSYDRLRNDDDDPGQSAGSVPVLSHCTGLRGLASRLSLRVGVFTVGGLQNYKRYRSQKRQYAAELRTWQLSNKIAQPEASKVSAHVRLLQVR
jgi:hypothetical protein